MSSSIYSIGARTLVELFLRQGGLSSLTFHQLSAHAGTRTHQSFFRYIQALTQNAEYLKEQNLSCLVHLKDLSIQVNGRADLLLLPQNLDFSNKQADTVDLETIWEEKPQVFDPKEPFALPFIIEVKTAHMPIEEMPDPGPKVHWGQALIYAAMLYLTRLEALSLRLSPENASLNGTPSAPKMTAFDWLEIKASKEIKQEEIERLIERYSLSQLQIPYALAYVSQTDLSCRIRFREISLKNLAHFFFDLIDRYRQTASNEIQYLTKRDQSIQELSFPYQTLRDGQKELMLDVLRSIRERSTFLAELPTGTGKTLAALFPSIKALPTQSNAKVFYLTAKTSTRHVAEEALKQMRAQGLFLRSLTLTAKEKICLAPEIYCDPRICPYAQNYYQHLPEGIRALLPQLSISAEQLQEIGEKHQLCPFELGLDASLFCDVIIGDYNHVLNPRVRIDRFFNQGRDHHILLFDEAHNLAERSRDMFSAELKANEFAEVLNQAEHLPETFVAQLKRIERWIQHWAKALIEEQIDLVLPKLDENWASCRRLVTPHFCAVMGQSDVLNQHLRELIKLGRSLFELDMDPTLRRALLTLYSSIRFFLRVCDDYWNESYIFALKAKGDQWHIKLICLDPSRYVQSAYAPEHTAVFFSATLSPLSYYKASLAPSDWVRSLQLPSPFPKENLHTLVYTGIKTTYASRQASKEQLAKIILEVVKTIQGHILVYFPSFAYMKMAEEALRLQAPQLRPLCQKPKMTRRDVQHFLNHFSESQGTEPLLGFAVLGGLFGEGIDLSGRALDAVVIVGVGLPMISPERDLMRSYYDSKEMDGYFFAYLYPGFKNVLQAAGRLIRSAEDTGLLLLLDERFGQEVYRDLFPDHWQAQFCDRPSTLVQSLKKVGDELRQTWRYLATQKGEKQTVQKHEPSPDQPEDEDRPTAPNLRSSLEAEPLETELLEVKPLEIEVLDPEALEPEALKTQKLQNEAETWDPLSDPIFDFLDDETP